ncbi:hypothetical protein EAX61_09335 [Dokdonia sinensis]|uniref:Uncharacterized protein n=1 Tax=Dokdonia sinensis TaxID=2479847 RepID=A0A3M0GBR9_9FLAO|nr:DUF6804 family protein [Dokdonia sinensis]RMB58499.1 hypothetical protein EAX61_09335 [Dokdonia sinensis]
MKPKIAPILKVILAIALLLCLLDMPYGYYQLVRYIAFMVFVVLAFDSNESGYKRMALIYVLLAITFQPFVKLSLGRFIWNAVDVGVATFLLVSLFVNPKNEKPSDRF